ncbi:Fanconi anemia group B protein [Mugil cephalus]|uniref:Fanconi anemia group B protein n=1 Tax=Mugil cephalus TaxID=48193 RepID=UPI001FB85E8C|nr:Fanconi anemia group B protein [Mugil cephalus]
MESLCSEDLRQNPHRLSLCGNVILFDCERASNTKDNETTELTFRRLSFRREDNGFVKAADGAAVISRKRSAHVDIVKCKCAVDVQKRVTAPCVLLTKKGEKGKGFKYSLLSLSSSNRLEHRFDFKVPYEINENVDILQGPTVLWTHEESVFYASVQTGGVRQVPARLSHCVVGELPCHKGQTFVLGLQSNSEICFKSTRQALGCLVEDGQMFDGATILPPPYLSITKCSLVLSADRSGGVLECVVVAATSNQQLVYCEGGIVRDICQLPFEQPESIQVVHAGRNGCLFVISSHQGQVCAVWKETFQIASQWSGVSSVHVDDFLGCGTDQMLLVFKDQGAAEQPLERFLITDLCGISYSRGQDNDAPKITPPPPENYLLTLQALESRLQSGLAVLQELQREVRVKDRVLQQSVQALTDVVSEREAVLTHPEQEGLIALWDCEEDDDESKADALDDKMQVMPAVSSKPQIDKLWHRVTEDRVVVGVILTSDGSLPVSSVSLSILTEAGQSSTPAVIQTQSQVFLLPSPCPSPPSTSTSSSSASSSSSSRSASLFLEPTAKRSRQHNASTINDLNTCRLAVTAVTELALLLNSGRVKCRVMLHYVQRRDAFGLVSRQAPAVLQCGRVVLDVHNDFQTQLLKNPQLKTDEAREDFLSLLAVLDCCVFHVDSPDNSLGDINGWIQKRVGCEKIEASPGYLLLNSAGPSALMLLRWHQITPFRGELSVHSSHIQMLQFLNSLLEHLPASCSILPARGTRGRGTSQIFAAALEKEVVSLREGVSALLCKEDESEAEKGSIDDTPDPGSAEGLRRCREVWRQDVERSREKLSPLVDVGRYRRLVQNMSGVQLDGDLAALLDTRRTLLG